MKNIIKTFGLLLTFGTIPAAFAATSRVGMVSNPATRLPSIAGYITASGTTATTVSGSTTAASLLSNAECIDSYSSCIKGADVCGSGLEECTTNVLFHGKMANCLGVLAQCSSSGVNDLFGTSSIAALATVKSTNAAGEVTAYTYPTDGSVLGQMITGAKIANQYDTAQCVKKYTNCLKKESVCGADFELCTSNTEFKKQSVYCLSTLARCQSEGITELFGSTNTAAAPSATSRIGTAITEGAALAAVNAVSTCYKVTDQCILNACSKNPNYCIEGKSKGLAVIADAVNEGVSGSEQNQDMNTLTKSEVMAFIRNTCVDTVGANKYCYATSTVGDGNMPTAAQLKDPDNQIEVFDDLYGLRMTAGMKQQIQKLADNFDKKTKDKCGDTIKSCAMRSCGGGLGSICYNQVFLKTGAEKSINGKDTYGKIRTACEPIINSDKNCQYAAKALDNTLYTYNYTDSSVFTTLFPEFDGTSASPDPIGVVGSLNASLSTSYNAAAIENMKKQCANTAIACVKSMCGKDYTNCYRNRTDVMGNTYDTGEAGFDKSMNKVGGVLDYTIVTGLCINTVKSSNVCEEHLKIQAYDLEEASKDESAWSDGKGGSYTSTASAWLDSGRGITAKRTNETVTIGCSTASPGDSCDPNAVEACDYVDSDGCVYDQPVTQSWATYSVEQSANNLFREVLRDIEKEAQAKYNAKLTKEQNVCLAKNDGGIRGAGENGSTYMWVKLKSNKIPKDYPMKGLQTKNFTPSNDLYGSFCRIRVTVTSDDITIQNNLGGEATAYFAIGDTFTCGSWISQATLDKITKAVGEQAQKEAGKGSAKEKATLAWSSVGGFLAGGLGGYFGMDALQNKGGSLGGLLSGDGVKQTRKNESNAEKCISKAQAARTAYNAAGGSTGTARTQYLNNAVSLADEAKSAARSAGLDTKGIVFDAIGVYTTGSAGTATKYKLASKDYKKLYDLVYNLKYACMEERKSDDDSACHIAVSDCDNRVDAIMSKVVSLRDMETEDKDITEIKRQTEGVYTELKSLATNMSTMKKGSVQCQKVQAKANEIPNPSDVSFEENPDKIEGKEAVSGKMADEQAAMSTFKMNLDKLDELCQDKVDGEDDDEKRKRRNINLIAGVATSAVGAALGGGIAKTVLDIKYENAANEAIKTWMQEIGNHIQCHVGAEEAGTYGEAVVITYDD